MDEVLQQDCWYDAEDCGCACTEEGVESEWEWDADLGCYVCNGCGDQQ